MKNVNETVRVIFGHFFVKNTNFTKIIGNNTIQSEIRTTPKTTIWQRKSIPFTAKSNQ